MQQLISWVSPFFSKLVAPHPDVVDPDDRYEASLLTGLVISALFTDLIGLVYFLSKPTAPLIVYLTVAACVLLAFVYQLGRTRYYGWGVWLFLFYIFVFVFFLLAYFRTTHVALFAFAPAYITSLFRSVRQTIISAVICLLIVVGAATIFPGEWEWLPFVLFYLVMATMLSVVFLHRLQKYDVTLKERNAQLATSESRLRAVLDGSLNGFYFFQVPSNEGQFPEGLLLQDMNSVAEKLIGCTRQDIMNKPVAMLPEGVPLGAILGAKWPLFDGRTLSGEWETSDQRWFEYQIIKLSDESVALSLAEVTDRKRADADRLALAVEQERVGVLRRFIGDVSHDLMTPITIMKNSLFLLGVAREPVMRQKHQMETENQLERLQKMIQDMLDLVRLDSLEAAHLHRVVIDLRPLLSELSAKFQIVAEANKQQLDVNFPDQPLSANVDGTYLRTAVTNLLDNAIKYSGENNPITLSAEQKDDHILITVSDNGEGIAVEDIPHVFTRFYRASHHRPTDSGAGLGLSIAKRIIEAHNGEIRIESRLGEGTTFYITLPSAS